MQVRQVISATNTSILLAGKEVGYMQNVEIQANYGLQKIKNLYQEEVQGFVLGISEYTCTATRAFVELNTIFGALDDILDIFSTAKGVTDALNNPNASGFDKLKTTISGIKDLGQSITSLYNDITGSNIQKSITDRDERVLGSRFNAFIQNNSRTDILRDLFSRVEFEVKLVNPALRVSNLSTDPLGPVDQLLGQIQSGTVQQQVSNFLNDPLKAAGDALFGAFETNTSEADLMTLRGCKLTGRNMVVNVNNIAIMEGITIFARTLTEGQNLRKRVVGA